MREPGAGEPRYILELYVAGSTVHSTRAARSIREICALFLGRGCRLEVIDIYREAGRARQAQVVAVPTLLRRMPGPLRKLVGDLSDRERVLRFLDLPPTGGSAPSMSGPGTSDPQPSTPPGL